MVPYIHADDRILADVSFDGLYDVPGAQGKREIFRILLQFLKRSETESHAIKYNYALFEQATSGIERALYEVKRPDDPSQAHTWSEGDHISFNLMFEKVTVEVQINSISWKG